MPAIQHWWHGGNVPLLLDLAGLPTPVVAYSVRKLRAAYSGNCMKVRRSSDNTTQDIGFVGNYIDTASLLSFCGAGDGFVDTWYTQIGSVDAVQATTGSQPKIVSGGSLMTRNSLATLDFDGSADHLTFSQATFNNYDFQVASVAYVTSAASARTICADNHGDGIQYTLNSTHNPFIFVDLEGFKITSSSAVSTNVLHSLFFGITTGDVVLGINGALQNATIVSAAGKGTMFIGRYGLSAVQHWDDGISEYVMWQEATNVSNVDIGRIQANSKAYFSTP